MVGLCHTTMNGINLEAQKPVGTEKNVCLYMLGKVRDEHGEKKR